MNTTAYRPVLKASSYYLEDVLGLNLEARAQEGSLSFILLNQPPTCNYRCKRCFVPGHRMKYFIDNKEKWLTADDYRRILGDAAGQGVMCLEISGEGEPLCSDRLIPTIGYASEKKLMTTLITNGDGLKKEQAELFRDSGVTLVFSMPSLDKENYEADTGVPGSFERKVRNVDMAAEVYAGTRTPENGRDVYRLAIHTTLEKGNEEDVEKLGKFCGERDMFFSIAPLALTGCALKHPEIHPEGGERPIEEVVALGYNSIIHSHSSAKALGREVCGTAYYGLNIGWDGEILFDAHCGYEVGEKGLLGNIRDLGVGEAVKRQPAYMKALFSSIDGSCPLRDPKGKDFLKNAIDGKAPRSPSNL